MKKKLLAGVVLGLLSSGVFAQSQTQAQTPSSVTLYGAVDAALTVYKGVKRENGTKHSLVGIDSGIEGGSRFGFKGAEDLGGGTSAIFQIEAGFTADNGKSGQGGTLFGRQAFVGFDNKTLGTVKLGRQYSYLDGVIGDGDALGNGYTGAIGNLIDYQDRINNAISYTTASYAGFSAGVMYGFGEQTGAGKNGGYAGAMVAYNNDAFNAEIGYGHGNYETSKDTDTKSKEQYSLALSYDFTAVKVFGLYSFAKTGTRDVTESGSTVTVNGPFYDSTVKAAALGVAVPFGANTFMLSYGAAKANHKDPQKARTGVTAKQLALAYTYTFSKRTDFYASYAYIHNGNHTEFSTISGNQGLALGVRHQF